MNRGHRTRAREHGICADSRRGLDHSRVTHRHFADDDPYEPRSNVDALEQSLQAAGRAVAFHHYPGTTHWFLEPDRVDSYNREAASLAWERTLQFLGRPSDRA